MSTAVQETPAPTAQLLRAGDSSISLRAVLKLPVVRRGMPEVLCGDDQLDRLVRWVHAGEVPNIAALMKGGELLLTTGMGIGASEREQRHFADQLDAHNIAAVAIELGSSLDSVPAPLAARASELGVPVIALRRAVPFVEVTESVHREIVNRQFVLMRRADALHQQFTSLMLEGAEIPEVLGVLAAAIANPVLVESEDEGVLYHATHHADDAMVLAAWSAAREGRPTVPIVRQPIPASGQGSRGALLAIGLDSPLGDFERAAIERAVGLLALRLLQGRQEALLAARERGDFLAQLIERDGDDAETAARAMVLGFPKQPRWMLPVAMLPSPTLGPIGADEATWATVWRGLRRTLTRHKLPTIVGSRGPGRAMLAVIAVEDERTREDVAEVLAKLVEEATEEHYARGDAVVLAIGPEADQWGEVRDGLRGVQHAVWPAAHGPRRRWHDVTRADLDRLLWSLRDERALEEFVQLRLRRLREHDEQRGSDLMGTLRIYCEHAGRRGDTARALHIERQTLYYRLGRIESILDLKLTDGDSLLDIHLALRAEPYVRARARLAGD